MVFCKISWKIIEKKVLENDRCSDYTFLKVENEKWKNFNFYADVSNWNCMWVFVEENDILFWEKQKFIVNYLNNSVLNIFDDNLDEKNIYSGIRDVNILDLQECKFENWLLNYFYFFIIFLLLIIFILCFKKKIFVKFTEKSQKEK